MAAFMEELQHLKIPLEQIKLATDNFSDNKVIGKGGFGKVYKGQLKHFCGSSMVAFKRLDRKFGQGDSEFLKEIMLLSRYMHEHLISLLGFSNEGDEKILVYEFASRGSLDCHLSDATLTWTQRLKICLSAAKGLSHLHDSNTIPQRVVHCDIKSSNILLDDNWNAKLSDFGLSKICPANQKDSFLITNPVGTPGYCDPCYMKTYTLTKESDVYSFGVVLLEVLFGRLCYEHVNRRLHVLVPMWKQKYEEEKLDEIIFHDLKQQMASSSLKSFVDIAYRCLEKSHKKRPTITCVIEELETAFRSQELYEEMKQPPHHEDTTRTKICAACNNEIGRHHAYLIWMGEFWHRECLRCHFCNKPITGYECFIWGNYPYHKSCLKDHCYPKCDVCQDFIPRNSAGRLKYLKHSFWAQNYCLSHDHDGTPVCCSCDRMEPRERRYAALDDGRKVCADCFNSSIMNAKDCQPLYLDIHAFYESLNMKFEQKTPITLVKRQTLNETCKTVYGEGNEHDPKMRGLCLFKKPTGSTVPDMRTEPYKLTHPCVVTGLYILYGYPRLLTGSILADLMMMAWLRLQGYPELNEDVEMGIRQVLAYMWLRSQIDLISSRNTATSYSATSSTTQMTSSVFDKLLAEFLKHEIESGARSGKYFRVANQAVLKYGLPTTLDHIRLTGSFPE